MWRIRAPLLALLLMQVVLLASAGATAVKKPLGKQDTCNMKNHMIEYLRNNGVQIYERPQISSVYCKTEWDVYGTCCDGNQMAIEVREKTQLNQLALEAVVGEIRSISSALRKFKSSQNSAHKEKVAKQNQKQGGGITFETASAITNESRKDAKNSLKTLLSDIDQAAESRVANQQKCVAKINSVISKSACSICSGRSDDFFNKDGKLKISEDLCRNVLRACSGAWVGMVDLVHQVKNFTHNVRTLAGFSDEDGSLEEKGFTMNLDSFITNRNLIPILKTCHETGLANCPFESVAGLCEQFIHIQAPTYIESSQSQINKLITGFSGTELRWNDTQRLIPETLSRVDLLLHQFMVAFQPDQVQPIYKEAIYLCDLISLVRRIWRFLQNRLPLLRKFRQQADTATAKRIDDIDRRTQLYLTQIQNTIAVAALRKFRILRLLLTRLPDFLTSTEFQVLSHRWDRICAYIQQTKFRTAKSKHASLFKRLGDQVLSREDHSKFKWRFQYLDHMLTEKVISLMSEKNSVSLIAKKSQLQTKATTKQQEISHGIKRPKPVHFSSSRSDLPRSSERKRQTNIWTTRSGVERRERDSKELKRPNQIIKRQPAAPAFEIARPARLSATTLPRQRQPEVEESHNRSAVSRASKKGRKLMTEMRILKHWGCEINVARNDQCMPCLTEQGFDFQP